MSALERLARIVHEHVVPEEPWEDCPGLHEDHTDLVRAILTALREPSEGMITALNDAASPYLDRDPIGPSWDYILSFLWTETVDSILNEDHTSHV